jgi:transcriptional regulator with XRE-family HTH domain
MTQATDRVDKEITRDLRMFGRNLCAARERIGPCQMDFATLSKSDRSKISRIECGKQAPKFDTLLTLARAAHVKPAELLSGVGAAQLSPEAPNHKGATPRTPAAQFGANLKWARERAKLSHEELGSNAPADRALISDWEKGKREPNLRTILKLARALEIPPALLLHEVELDPRRETRSHRAALPSSNALPI